MMALALNNHITHVTIPKKKKNSYSTYGCIWYCSTHQLKKKLFFFFCFVDQTKGNTLSKI